MALQVGQPFGNFRIVQLIGEGGFGEVYLAENPLIDRRVAVKVLHAALAQDAELVGGFSTSRGPRVPSVIPTSSRCSTLAGRPMARPTSSWSFSTACPCRSAWRMLAA